MSNEQQNDKPRDNSKIRENQKMHKREKEKRTRDTEHGERRPTVRKKEDGAGTIEHKGGNDIAERAEE